MNPSYLIWPYDCVDAMLPLIDEESVHCVVTSPPYFNLRDYETGEWRGGDPACNHEHGWVGYPGTTGAAPRNIAANRAKSIRRNGGLCPCGARFDDGQIGHEATPAEYVARLVQVARAVRRVLRRDGTFWLNLGDSYASNPKGPGGQDKSTLSNNGLYERAASAVRPKPRGIAVKQSLGMPWRVAFALQDDGWYLRDAIVWRKTNPMPESVRDRCTRSYEHIFMFARSPRYYYDATAIAEPFATDPKENYPTRSRITGRGDQGAAVARGNDRGKSGGFPAPTGKRNKRNVWTVATKPFKGAHFATFPPDLIEPCILAGSPPSCCATCGAPRVAKVEKTKVPNASFRGSEFTAGKTGARAGGGRTQGGSRYISRVVGYFPSCSCGAADAPAVVLDPFGGSGTTALVALRHNRSAVLCELNPGYIEMAHRRIAGGR